MATSGNGVELLHTKAVPKWGWVVAWAVGAAFLGLAIDQSSGIELLFLWFMLGVAVVGAFLPLVCKNGRIFAEALQCWFLLLLLSTWGYIVFLANATGDYVNLFWTPFFITIFCVLRFRPKWFLLGFFGIGFLSWVLIPPVKCIIFAFTPPESEEARPFGECLEKECEKAAPMLSFLGCFVVVLLGRKFSNDVWSYRAAKTSRDRHRCASLTLSLSLFQARTLLFSHAPTHAHTNTHSLSHKHTHTRVST